MSKNLTIEVTAEILPGKPDPNATAQFANADRASQYAQILIEAGDYSAGGVWLTDSNGTRHRFDRKDAPTDPTESVSGETHWRCSYCDANTRWGTLTCSGCGYTYGHPSPRKTSLS